MRQAIEEIEEIIRSGTKDLIVSGKIGQRLIQPRIAKILEDSGFEVDLEDSQSFLPAGTPAWRDKSTREVVETKTRLKIDLVVRLDGAVVAMVEVESDLNDLRETGVTKRSGHYDVFSISRNSGGHWFHSYKSLERMASAASHAAGRSISDIAEIASDLASDHNPKGFGVFLVTGSSRELDRRILAPRIASLDAKLISLVERR
jgi:hypothetical protein